jgi:hypothetical protein
MNWGVIRQGGKPPWRPVKVSSVTNMNVGRDWGHRATNQRAAMPQIGTEIEYAAWQKAITRHRDLLFPLALSAPPNPPPVATNAWP